MIPTPDWQVLRDLRTWDETAALRGLILDGPEVAASHRRPGQYLKLRLGEREGFMALASAPGQPLQLLVKRGPPLADALACVAVGATVDSSLAQGAGFPLDEARGRDLLLFAAGSGIAPLRAGVQAVLGERRAFGRVSLFYGQRTPEEVAYRGEAATWAAGGIELHPVISQPPPGSWSGARGHVQEAFLQSAVPVAEAVAFLCGMKAMVAGVKAALGQRGLPPERLFLNA